MTQADTVETLDVSICIANYNGEDIIDDCINSVLGQLGDINFEIIVHDDASTDDSVAKIKKYRDRVTLIESTSNVGFCISNNRMVERARGKYILLLNNDAALFHDALTKLLEASSSALGIFTLPQYDWETQHLVDCGCFLDPFYNPIPNKDPNCTEVAMVIGACLWISKELWYEIGGFPNWIESIGEDILICCKARLLGYSVHALTNSGYRHRQGYTFGGNKPSEKKLNSSIKRRRLSERNKTYVMYVCTPAPILIPLMLAHTLMLLLEGVILSLLLRNQGIFSSVYLNALVSLLAARKQLKQERAILQRRRKSTLASYLRPFIWKSQKLKLLLSYGIPSLKS